jgi:UDP-N-acetylmuramate dehydrogenase
MQRKIAISKLTTMGLGGPADYVCYITKRDQVVAAYDFAKQAGLPTYALGRGSNVIGRDEGFAGVVLVNQLKGLDVLRESNNELVLRAAAGELLDDVVEFTTSQGYSGMEALAAIPGTIGAAPVQNVGAYGQEIAQVLLSVEVYDPVEAEFKTFSAEHCQLGYRKSIFNTGPEAGRYFIVSVELRLTKTSLKPPFYESLQKYIDAHHVVDLSPASIRQMVNSIRVGKLPNPKAVKSSGSFFKNVAVSDAVAKELLSKGVRVYQRDGRSIVPSAWLIEQVGLKGKELHGMRVSPDAALVLINESAKSYADLAAARQKIVQAVQDKFGLTPEQEPVELV